MNEVREEGCTQERCDAPASGYTQRYAEKAAKSWEEELASYGIKRTLFSKKSRYQQIDVVETRSFGRMLFLDHDLQIAEGDDVYNSNLVSPIVKNGGRLEKVLILGGGDGGVANELLKYNAGEVVLVDIDAEVVRACKEFMPKVWGLALNDPRVKVIIGDAFKYLEEPEEFDAIIYDLTEHPETITGIERSTFFEGVFSNIGRNLKKRGFVTMQCGPEGDTETLRILDKILKDRFANVKFVKDLVPSYRVNWVFASARKK